MSSPIRFRPIVGVLVYVWNQIDDTVLMVHRIARHDDGHLGKYNGLGGKMEVGEDVASAARREIREESGLELHDLTLRGTISWPGFDGVGGDWLGFIFIATRWSGTPPEANEEGPLHWIDRSRLFDGSLPMWDGDRHFLALLFDGDQRVFHGVMPYVDGAPNGWEWSRL